MRPTLRVQARPPDEALADKAFSERLSARLGPRNPIELSESEHPGIHFRTFVAPIVIERDVVGRLWVLGVETPLEALERRALEHAATVVALEFLKQRIAAEVESRLAGELLDDLLDGRVADPQSMRARAMHLGYDLTARQTVLVASLDVPNLPNGAGPQGDPMPSRRRQLISLADLVLRRLRLDGLVGELDGRVVMLLSEASGRSSDAARDVADTLRRDVRAYLPGATMTVAYGPWEADVALFPRCYRIARGALELTQRHGSPDRTVAAGDLGITGLLLSVDRLDELARFAAETLTPLRTYDERRSSELLTTLAAYLAHGCRPGETAEALVVHPNTIAYRIRRIETLLGLDLGRPDAQLRVQLALAVDEIISVRATADGGAD